MRLSVELKLLIPVLTVIFAAYFASKMESHLMALGVLQVVVASLFAAYALWSTARELQGRLRKIVRMMSAFYTLLAAIVAVSYSSMLLN